MFLSVCKTILGNFRLMFFSEKLNIKDVRLRPTLNISLSVFAISNSFKKIEPIMKFFLPTLFLLLSVLVAIECQNKRFSYESVNFPGYFLHVRGGNLIWIDKFTPANPQKFIQEASFVLVPGLADNSKSDLISLMSMSKPNYYLTVQNSGKPAKMVESTGDNNFNRVSDSLLILLVTVMALVYHCL